MDTRVKEALGRWGLSDAAASLAAHRENQVFRVVNGGSCYALRFHRAGYRNDAELASELDWMAAVSNGGVSVPRPVASTNNRYLEHVQGLQVDLLSWLPGQTLADEMAGASSARRVEVFTLLGRQMAEFHNICDGWTPPETFDRAAWDRAGLVGQRPLWGRFWENPALNADDAGLFRKFRAVADADLHDLEAGLDYGLIHADMLGENVLVDGTSINLIDFDDGGWGFRLFEPITALVKHIDDDDYPELKGAVFDGYRTTQPLDDAAFDLLMALRATTYVGWIADRTDLPDADERQKVNTDRARRLINRYLGLR